MGFRGWNRTKIVTEDGTVVDALAPLIVSASRATDIPAFYAPWFMARLRAGYLFRPHPYNPKRNCHVSFRDTRAIVFWSKNPRPLFGFVDELEERELAWVVQFTLNDYVSEGLEPGLPPLGERLDTFRMLADRIGPERVIWRFDPLLLTQELTVDLLLERLAAIASILQGYTGRLVFSFVDIERYRNVCGRLGRSGTGAREFTPEDASNFAARLGSMNREWGFSLATCAEAAAFEGVAHNRCVDGELLAGLCRGGSLISGFPCIAGDLFGTASSWEQLKDPGQRRACGCTASLDIGGYGSCPHRCAYCYANGQDVNALLRFHRHDSASDRLVP